MMRAPKGWVATGMVMIAAASTSLTTRSAMADGEGPWFIIDLGVLDDDALSVGYSASESGVVVGKSDGIEKPIVSRAFAWDDGRIADITTGFGLVHAIANGINAAGDTVGVARRNINEQDRAALWRNGRLFDLGVLPGAVSSVAYAINDLGAVTGASSGTTAVGEAFLWYNDQMIGLGNLGAPYSEGRDLNNTNEVVGYSLIPQIGQRAFIWTNGVMQDLGVLGGNNSSAEGINDLGEVVGYSTTDRGFYHAFRWSNGVMVDLGSLGFADSYAYSINDEGVVVGYSFNDELRRTAFIHRDSSGMVALNELLPPRSGWWLESAYDINEFGQITGLGVFRGEQHGFLLTPLRPRVLAPTPGEAGEFNTVRVGGLTPDGLARIYYGFRRGEGSAQNCPTISLQIESPQLLALVRASAAGVASIEGFVPQSAAGRNVLFQVVDQTSCVASEVLTARFE
ncbi:MAG: hypothetical protein ACF8PN_16410 [Phycisphaerales bacterium]